MAGLLDDLLTSDSAQLGLGLLAAGGPSTVPMDFGQRLAQGVQFAQASKDARLRNKLLESQIAENASQDAVRRAQLERQQRQDSYYLGSGSGSPAAPAAGAVAAGGAAPEPGAVLKAAAGAPADAPPPAQGKFAEWSKQYNIPVDALVADYFSNGGKGIADMLFKAGRPDMQVQNGYVYDKNRVQPGFLPSLNTSQDGKSTLTLVDPATGLPRVMPTPGAVESFGAFQEAGNRSAANYQPERVIDPATGQTVVVPRSEVLQPRPALPGAPLGATLGERNNNPGNLRPPGASTGFQRFESPEAGLAALDQNLQAYGKRGINTIEGVINRWAPSNENNTAAYVSSVAKRLGIDPKQQIDLGNPYVRQALGTAIMLHENGTGILTRGTGGGGAPLIGPGAGRGSMGMPGTAPVTAGNVVELSPQQQAQNEAERVRQVKTAEADVVRDSGKADAMKRGSQIREIAKQAEALLDKNPTASGAGALLDSALNFVGQPTAGGTVAQQLEALSGWMVSNVPRMEGPQSNVDVLNYTTMAGRVGDRTLPIEARKAALKTVIELQNKYAELNGGAPSAPSPAPAPRGLPQGWTVKVK